MFLLLRRMSLVGDAMSHAILPGVAIGFLAAGLNVFAMTLGGLAAGLLVAVLAGAGESGRRLPEDASLAVFFLVSLAFGVVIVSLNGIDVERLMEFLFGETAAKMNADKLIVIVVNSTISMIALALIYRPLALDCVDPGFLRSVSRAGGVAHLTFLALLVLNLISAFHALGTLLGVGIMIIPAAGARFWSRDISVIIALTIASPCCPAGRDCCSPFTPASRLGPPLPWWRPSFMPYRCCLGGSADWFGDCSHGAILKLRTLNSDALSALGATPMS